MNEVESKESTTLLYRLMTKVVDSNTYLLGILFYNQKGDETRITVLWLYRWIH